MSTGPAPDGPAPDAPDPDGPAPSHPANWYPDPLGRYEHRWYDGAQWTDQVATGGQPSVDPDGIAPTSVPRSLRGDDRVARQVQGQVDHAGGAGSGVGAWNGLLDADVLVVNQKAKFIEVSNQYMVYDEHGTQVGGVRQVGQSGFRKALRLLSDVDQYLTHRLEVTDTTGRTLLRLTRPAKVFKSTIVVEDASGAEVGRIVQQNMIGKIRFALLAADGTDLGSLNARNWRAWDFHVLDAEGTEVAAIKKTFEGIARALFTTADNYVVRIHRPLQDPLRSLVVASALSVDTALKQDDRS